MVNERSPNTEAPPQGRYDQVIVTICLSAAVRRIDRGRPCVCWRKRLGRDRGNIGSFPASSRDEKSPPAASQGAPMLSKG